MKQYNFHSLLQFAVVVFLLSSCGNTEVKTTTDTMNTDSTGTTNTTTDVVAEPTNVMVVTHKVANYQKWKASYEAHDSMKLASGIHNYILGRGVEDSNTIMVAVKIDDFAKAKAFANDPALKVTMQKSGVIGKPSFKFITLPFLEADDAASNIRVMTTHKVKDWESWRKYFEGSKNIRLENGLSDRAYGYDVDDNHFVTVVLTVTDTAKARAFMNSDLLKQKMTESGVVGKAKRFMYTVAHKY